jgi:hypothetical protein
MSLFVKAPLLLATAIAAATAAHPSFTAHADLQPTGCVQSVIKSVVHVGGCSAQGATAGAFQGTLQLAYVLDSDPVHGIGVQRGTFTLTSTGGADVLVARFGGVSRTSTGLTRGLWIAQRRTGVFAKLAAHGSYTSTTPDQGVHVSFDLRA